MSSRGKTVILVRSGFYKNIPQIWWLKTTEFFFLTVLEAGSLRPGCQHDQVRALCPVQSFLLCLHMVEEGLGSSMGSFL